MITAGRTMRHTFSKFLKNSGFTKGEKNELFIITAFLHKMTQGFGYAISRSKFAEADESNWYRIGE